MKIALIGPNGWALGSIHHFLEKYLSPYFEIKNFYWHDANQVQQALGGDYQIVIGEAHIMDLEGMGYTIGENVTLIPIFHNNVITQNSAWFNVDRSTHIHFHQFYSITQEISNAIKKVYGVDTNLLPVGVCDDFWKKKTPNKINTLGQVYDINLFSNPDYESIKRHSMFEEIRKKSGLQGGTIYGKHYSLGAKIYDGFDLVVCTSKGEGLPTPFLECAAAKIPFISTKVGIIPEYKSVKTFETVEEAVNIINYLKSSPEVLKEYVDKVYEEVINDRNWKRIIIKYWKPQIEKLLNT